MTTMEASQPAGRSRLDELLDLRVHVNVEVIAYTAILLITVLTRFADLGTRVMSHDESLHTYYSYQLSQHGSFQHSPLMHGPLQFHLIALSYLLFGASDATARIPAALFSIAAVAMVIPFRRYLGRWGAILAAVMMAISPYMLYYGRYVRNEALIVPLALAMFYAVFRYFEDRQAKWLYLLAAALALHFTAKETAFIYAAQLMVFLALFLALRLMREPWENDRQRLVFAGALAVATIGLALAGAGLVGDRPGELPAGGETQQPLDPTMEQQALATDLPPLTIFGAVVTLAAALTAAGITIRSRGRRLQSEYPSLDLLLITGSVVLPQLAAFAALALGWDPMNYQDSASVWKTGIVVAILVGIAAVIGLAWNRRRWLISFGIFYAIFALFYTTVLTHPFGLFTGLVGALGYWLEQHGVNRGSQPLFYYIFIQIPIYEFLPALGALAAAFLGIRSWLNAEDVGVPDERGPYDQNVQAVQSRVLAIIFLGFWSLSATAAYTIAGERMPWLTVHIALPYILLAGWVFGRLFRKVDWQSLGVGWNWLIPVVMLVVALAFIQLIGFTLGPSQPFAGTTLDALRVTTGAVMSALVLAGGLVGLWYLARGWTGGQLLRILAVLAVSILGWVTARSAYRAAFIHYDQATEYLVYAHSATGVKTVMSEVRELSQRISDGMAIDVGYDDDVSWPFSWYMRDFTRAHYYEANITRELLNYPVVISGDNHWSEIEPILGDRYYSFQYVRMWWPNQDYFSLSRSDVEAEYRADWFEANPNAEPPPLTTGEYLRRVWAHIRPFFTDPQVRQAVWQIWFNRDFSEYAEYTGRDFSLQNWSPSDRMRMYVRKDVAALIWNYGLAEEAFAEVSFEDPYEDRSIELAAEQVVPGPGGVIQLQSPRNLAVGPDGSLFVADTNNHRVLKLSPGGEELASYGQFGTVDSEFGMNEPWGIDVAGDGSLYVADTWNHRILHISPEGELLGSYGTLGQAETLLSLWGPRDVAVHPDGRIFVSDTGNKRIVVLSSDGEPLESIASGGAGLGQLDEPVGLAFDSQGNLYVADTWNQRIQIFQDGGDGFIAVDEWTVDAWYGQSLDNKPYLDVGENGVVCASDPEGFRVLCFDSSGQFLAGWGSSGEGSQQFGLPSGIAFESEGKVWISDARNGRVMLFEPPIE